MFRQLQRVKKCGISQQKRRIFDVTTVGNRATNSGVIVTVFGCTGFIGRFVVNAFARIGSPVIIPYRGIERSYSHLKVLGDVGQIVPVTWDIRDKDSIRSAMQHSNVVVNLVGRSYDTRNFTMRDVHVEGAKRIAEVAKEFDVDRFIHVSALGASSSAETDWLKTKAEGEAAVKSIFPKATIFRPGIAWGANDEFLNTHAQIMRFWPVYPLLAPDRKIQPIWANDIAVAIVNSLKHTDAVGQTYEIAGDRVITNRDLANWINTVLKTRRRIMELNEEEAWHLGYWSSLLRKPKFTLDTIKDNTDRIISGKYPGLSALEAKPIEFFSSNATACFIHYRDSQRADDITFEPDEGLEELKKIHGPIF